MWLLETEKLYAEGIWAKAWSNSLPTVSLYSSDVQRAETRQAYFKRSCCAFVQPGDGSSRNRPFGFVAPAATVLRSFVREAGAMHRTQQCRRVPGRWPAQRGRGHRPFAQGGRRGVAWPVPGEEGAEGHLGQRCKALRFQGEWETVPVACLFPPV